MSVIRVATNLPETLEMVRMAKKGKDKNDKTVKGVMTNKAITGIDLGNGASLATVLSPMGDKTDRFAFQMDQKGYALFSDRVPKDARIAYEATSMAYRSPELPGKWNMMTLQSLIQRSLHGSSNRRKRMTKQISCQGISNDLWM